MAQTTVNTASRLKKYERSYFKEFVRESGFAPYMGTGVNNPFVVKNQLVDGGQVINIPLVSALDGAGTGTGTLVGNEESLANASYDIKPYWHRHAIEVPKDQQHISSFDLRSAARDMLKIWDMDELRDGIIDALSAVAESSSAYNSQTGHAKQIYLSEASTAQKNAFAARGQYRLLFGNTEGNYSATFATALANVDDAADNLGVAEVRLLKDMAKRRIRGTVPSVRPIRVNGNEEMYILFTNTQNFRKLQADMETINLDGRPRDPDANPIFNGGDLLIDNVIVREIPEMPNGTDAGLSADQGPAYLCGAQALGLAWGQRPRATDRKEDDYGFKYGKGTESLWAVEKLIYNDLDHGVVTGFFYNG